MNWQSLVECSNAKPLDDTIKLPQAFKDHWKPNDIDRVVAWEFYDQLRSRIASQPMHYMHGDEATALESIFKLFGGTERGRSSFQRHRKGTQLFSIGGTERGRSSFQSNMNRIDCGDATTTTGLPRKYLFPCS